MGTVPPRVLLGTEPLAVLLQRNLLLFPVVFKLTFCYLLAVMQPNFRALSDINSLHLIAIARH